MSIFDLESGFEEAFPLQVFRRVYVLNGGITEDGHILKPPVPIPQAERDSVINVVREQLQERGGARQDWSKVPETRAAVTGMFLAEEGRLWVQTGSPGTLRTYDVYERSGVYVGPAVADLNTVGWLPPVVRGNHFWAVVTGEFDVPYVVRARIVDAYPSTGAEPFNAL
jgi:hypothetical protein